MFLILEQVQVFCPEICTAMAQNGQEQIFPKNKLNKRNFFLKE